MADDVLLRKGDIELARRHLDGAHIRFDDVPDRNILVAESGQTYILNDHWSGMRKAGDFAVFPVWIEITGRRIHIDPVSGEYSIRVKVFFPSSDPIDYPEDASDALGLLLFGNSKARLSNMEIYYNLSYRVRPRIEAVEEFGI
jgi:hypothetical protein